MMCNSRVGLLLAAIFVCPSGCTQKPAGKSVTLPAEQPATSSLIGERTILVGGGEIHVQIADHERVVTDNEIEQWVRASAGAVTDYFGHFPAKTLMIRIDSGAGGGVNDGLTNDAGIFVRLGDAAKAAELRDDWVMTHEMFHLSFPSMDDQYVWLSEGRATYLEPLARARYGTLSVEELWKEAVEGLPQGQPEAGDQGLDRTHTWGRTYWGGCMFYLLADIRIREQTHRQKSLDDAMRAIFAHGGDQFADWSMQQVIDVGDAATGTHVLASLYGEMAEKPVTVDLDQIWKRLGVIYQNGRVHFDDKAPLAEIRRDMTARTPSH